MKPRASAALKVSSIQGELFVKTGSRVWAGAEEAAHRPRPISGEPCSRGRAGTYFYFDDGEGPATTLFDDDTEDRRGFEYPRLGHRCRSRKAAFGEAPLSGFFVRLGNASQPAKTSGFRSQSYAVAKLGMQSLLQAFVI